MASGETSKCGFDNMASAVLVGILVDKTIGTSSSDCSGENAFSLGTGPFTRLFALFECLDGTGCQSGASSLYHALLALITSAAAMATAMATA